MTARTATTSTTLSSPSTPSQRLIAQTERATRSHRSRAARALDVEADAEGMQVWHVRSNLRRVLSSMPMPHEITSLKDARACQIKAEAIAAQYSRRGGLRSQVVSFACRPMATWGSTALIALIAQVGFDRLAGAKAAASVTLAAVALGLLVLMAVQWMANPPEVWVRRADAYKKRVTELQADEAKHKAGALFWLRARVSPSGWKV